MINSRLYYDMQELPEGILKFHYYTDEINTDSFDLVSYVKEINQEEVLLILNKIGVKNLLYNINEVEFSRLLNLVEKYKDYIEQLSCTDPSAANSAITKLWGSSELQRNFLNWFKKNGYAIPNK